MNFWNLEVFKESFLKNFKNDNDLKDYFYFWTLFLNCTKLTNYSNQIKKWSIFDTIDTFDLNWLVYFMNYTVSNIRVCNSWFIIHWLLTHWAYIETFSRTIQRQFWAFINEQLICLFIDKFIGT